PARRRSATQSGIWSSLRPSIVSTRSPTARRRPVVGAAAALALNSPPATLPPVASTRRRISRSTVDLPIPDSPSSTTRARPPLLSFATRCSSTVKTSSRPITASGKRTRLRGRASSSIVSIAAGPTFTASDAPSLSAATSSRRLEIHDLDAAARLVRAHQRGVAEWGRDAHREVPFGHHVDRLTRIAGVEDALGAPEAPTAAERQQRSLCVIWHPGKQLIADHPAPPLGEPA